MKSTGEVMGIDAVFGTAFAKTPGRGVRRAADQGPGVRQRRQPRQAGDDLPGQAAGRPRLRDARHRGDRRGAAPQRRRRRPSSASTRTGKGDDVVAADPGRRGRPGLNTPFGDRHRASTATRSAPPRCQAASRASRRSRASPPACRASRRWCAATSACGPCRSTTRAMRSARTWGALMPVQVTGEVVTRQAGRRLHAP